MHFAPGPADSLETWEVDLVQREVAAFERRARLRWSGTEDLVAEAQIAWWRQRNRYDPGRSASKETFLKRVVRHALKDVLKAEQTLARTAASRAVSLDAVMPGDSDRTLNDAIADADDDFRDVVFDLDLQGVLQRMTSRQRAVIQGRLAGEQTSALAEHLGVHRDTIYEELKAIRRIFRVEGLFD